MATNAPAVHYWKAGDGLNAERLNEAADSINWYTDPPLVHVTMTSGSIALPVTTWTPVAFTNAISDPYDMWDIGTPDTITVNVPGWYTVEIVMCVSNVVATDARLALAIWKQNAENLLRWDQQTNGNNGNVNVHKETTMFLNVGDTILLKAHVSAGARNIITNGSNESPQIRMRWISN
jgi:hypothetical protein